MGVCQDQYAVCSLSSTVGIIIYFFYKLKELAQLCHPLFLLQWTLDVATSKNGMQSRNPIFDLRIELIMNGRDMNSLLWWLRKQLTAMLCRSSIDLVTITLQLGSQLISDDENFCYDGQCVLFEQY